MFAEHWAIFGKRKPRVWKLDFYWCCGGVVGVEVRFLLWAFCNYWVFSIWRDIPQLIWQHLHMIIYTTTNNAPKEWVFRSKSFKKKKKNTKVSLGLTAQCPILTSQKRIQVSTSSAQRVSWAHLVQSQYTSVQLWQSKQLPRPPWKYTSYLNWA